MVHDVFFQILGVFQGSQRSDMENRVIDQLLGTQPVALALLTSDFKGIQISAHLQLRVVDHVGSGGSTMVAVKPSGGNSSTYVLLGLLA